MSNKRTYRSFQHFEAVFRICCDEFDAVTKEIVRQRRILEDYIKRHEDFMYSLEPVELRADAPKSARRMARAAELVGVGPMASVAGVMAQLAGEAGMGAGAREAIVENGGDVYIRAVEPVIISIYPGGSEVEERLGFSIQPEEAPISICSSSGKMGHSMSLGDCDLATVVSKDAALADAAATQGGNLVKSIEDVESALNQIQSIEGVDGVVIIKDGQVGMAGKLPLLVKIN